MGNEMGEEGGWVMRWEREGRWVMRCGVRGDG